MLAATEADDSSKPLEMPRARLVEFHAGFKFAVKEREPPPGKRVASKKF